MIFEDIYKALSEDVVLKDYLSPTPADSKIYPNFARSISAEPFITYKSSGVNNGEIIQEENITFQVFSSAYFVLNSIAARLCEVLEEGIPSTKYNIYFCKKINSQDTVADSGLHSRSQTFAFKFRKQ